MNIIGISGRAGAGKDTVANVFVDQYGFRKISMADPFKHFLQRIFEFSDDQLWGPSALRNKVDKRYGHGEDSTHKTSWRTAEARLREHSEFWIRLTLVSCRGLDEERARKSCSFEDQVQAAYEELITWFHWLETHHTSDLTPRIALQTIGTEWGRNKVHNDLWVDYMMSAARYEIEQKGAIGVVISDARLYNELQAIKAMRGKLVRIRRPSGDDAMKGAMASHSSEVEMDGMPDGDFDFLINNDSSIEDLQADVHLYAACLQLAEV